MYHFFKRTIVLIDLQKLIHLLCNHILIVLRSTYFNEIYVKLILSILCFKHLILIQFNLFICYLLYII